MGESRVVGGGRMKHKFRAWDRTTNQMRDCYGFNDMEQEVYVCSVADDEFNGRPKTVHALKRSFDEVVLMKSTGLKDKNGLEIFEGDIISELSEQGEDWANHILAEVVWHKVGFYGKEKGHEPEYPITEFVKGEVIGNVWENPELLEVAE